MTGRRWGIRSMVIAAALLAAGSAPALAHAIGIGFVMLLPTHFMIWGGAAAVAISAVAVLLIPPAAIARYSGREIALLRLPQTDPLWPGLLTLALLIALLISGWFGIRDPVVNPLPLMVWTVWRSLLPLLHCLFGDIWSQINPVRALYRLLDRLSGGDLSAAARPLPASIGYIPAIAMFLAFSWFELIYPAPEDPERLATAVAIYLVLTFAMAVTYGEAWFRNCDGFSVYFRFLALIAPLQPAEREERRVLVLTLPGSALLKTGALPLSGSLFVLITLAVGSFDALSFTFFYLGTIGVNPLEFTGRSSIMVQNSLGLILAPAALSLMFLGAVLIGHRLDRTSPSVADMAGRLVLSIVPIALAFHAAHYLTVLLVNGQYALLAANDPFGLGWNLLGMRQYQVTTSFMTTQSGAIRIWLVQTSIVIAGHLAAVVLVHALSAPQGREPDAIPPAATVPLAIVMVGYTLFGLWLLSTPAI